MSDPSPGSTPPPWQAWQGGWAASPTQPLPAATEEDTEALPAPPEAAPQEGVWMGLGMGQRSWDSEEEPVPASAPAVEAPAVAESAGERDAAQAAPEEASGDELPASPKTKAKPKPKPKAKPKAKPKPKPKAKPKPKPKAKAKPARPRAKKPAKEDAESPLVEGETAPAVEEAGAEDSEANILGWGGPEAGTGGAAASGGGWSWQSGSIPAAQAAAAETYVPPKPPRPSLGSRVFAATLGQTDSWTIPTPYDLTSTESFLSPVLAVVAVLLALVGMVRLLVGAPTKTEASTPKPQPSPTVTAPPFVPAATASGAGSGLKVILPEGSTMDLSYTGDPDLASLGVRTFASANLEGCCERQLIIDHGDPSIFYRTAKASSTYTGADGKPVGLYPTLQEGKSEYLVFQFGPWTVGIDNGSGTSELSETDRSAWATGLAAHVTPEGWLVFDPKPPIKMIGLREPTGPGVVIGNLDRRGVLIVPASCSAPEGKDTAEIGGNTVQYYSYLKGRAFAVWCLTDLQTIVQVYGDKPFIDSVLESLKIGSVHGPG